MISSRRTSLRVFVASKESTLEADVYNCLTRFGVTIFVARIMKDKKLANKATQPLAVLIGVLAKFGIKFRPKLLNNVNPEAKRDSFEMTTPAGTSFAKQTIRL